MRTRSKGTPAAAWFAAQSFHASADLVMNTVAVAPTGPHACCGEFALVETCDGKIDSMHCGVCDFRWTRPCSVGDLVPAVEV